MKYDPTCEEEVCDSCQNPSDGFLEYAYLQLFTSEEHLTDGNSVSSLFCEKFYCLDCFDAMYGVGKEELKRCDEKLNSIENMLCFFCKHEIWTSEQATDAYIVYKLNEDTLRHLYVCKKCYKDFFIKNV